ncbi:PepSY-associated TM helix domain-containing protein [Kordiimonas sp. SCSIO 12610]|uniref:PepSY-associated TM helix domain-containing protein n=1 Tax=Kordiimonas sp. SCSIO 12610 TaxID=2829597 RepID=UPI0021088F49|nr:PepSY-associated TM helix domain-containing protein [Kordiimonas sp. SCSIO 12610]UTW53927.1 PepSY domain-containing protein [Kordiimonas sp. SCSIO 12610]
MKTQKLFRQIHHWGSIIIAIPLLVMIGAGILLMLKKEIEWIQPKSQKGIEREAIPTRSLAELYEAAKTVEHAGITTWADLERVDVKADKGMVKFVSATNWEVQVDANTAEILQVAFRRSDIIEQIHDGSFFADWAKLWLFLPAGIVLFVLWITGIYLFFLPHVKKWQKKRSRKSA